MPAARLIWKVIWKGLLVFVAFVIGILGANQAGWSSAELVVNARVMGLTEGLITGAVALIGSLTAIGCLSLIVKLAKPLRWVAAPIFLYCTLVPGAWNGLLSDFDYTRGEAIRHGLANAYALQHMSPRGRLLSCRDGRIELTDDAQKVCAELHDPNSGEAKQGGS